MTKSAATSRNATLRQDERRVIRQRVLQAIAANRHPGLHFIGHFLNFDWQKVAPEGVRAMFPVGPHCRAANGEVDLVALGVFIDQSLAAAVRSVPEVPPGGRLGTIQLQAQFTGSPALGDLVAESRLLGHSEGASLRQYTATETLCAGDRPFCHLSGAYALLEVPTGVTLGPMPWEREPVLAPAPLACNQLEPMEREVLKACDAALRAASPQASFIERFWGRLPRRTTCGASRRIPIRPQITNRVGHVHGGVLFGLAAANACAAAPPAMMLSNLSAFFVSPGRGPALTIRSRLLHGGRTLAVVQTEIVNAAGGCVLAAVSNHAARRHR